MTIQTLINKLAQIQAIHGPDAEVWAIWDGEPRTSVDHVWFSMDGQVMLAEANEVVYSKESRPAWAPADGVRWMTPKLP